MGKLDKQGYDEYRKNYIVIRNESRDGHLFAFMSKNFEGAYLTNYYEPRIGGVTDDGKIYLETFNTFQEVEEAIINDINERIK